MKNKSFLFVLLMAIGISSAAGKAFGQDTQSQARKFDEFGYMNHENYSARLDNIAIQMQNEPANQGHFIFYNGRKALPGAALRYVKRLQNYLTNSRGLEPSRMVFRDGGLREEISVEFWLVPQGVGEPAPSPTLPAKTTGTGSYVYDRYSFDCHRFFRPKVKAPYYEDDCGYAGMGYEDQSARLDGFAGTIIQTPGASARLVVYSLRRDTRRLVQRFIQEEKTYLASKAGLDASRITVEYRRARHNRAVELWVVRA